MIGSKIGAYRIDSKLGEGGMGVVYRATDTELDRSVAIKTLIAGEDPESEARFLREAKLASRLQHPSIVTIYHFGVGDDHSRYIVMEFVEGKTLKKIINAKPMPMVQLCELGIQIGDALAVAHDKGVVHRDMKAENVMVTPRGQVKILDFGLAKLKESEQSTGNEETAIFKTQEGLVVGTVSHMSPEQAMGADVDARSDIFSLGVVLYEMATGEMPFNAPSAQATMAQVLKHNPAPVSIVNPEIPPEMDALVEQCLQKDRMLRPTAAEVVFRLKNVMASLSAKNLFSPEIRAVSGSTSAMQPVSSGPRPAMAPASGGVTAIPSARSTPAASAAAMTPAMPSSGSMLATAAPPVAASARATYLGIRAFRIVLSIASLAIPFAFFLYFVISGGLIRPQLVEGTAVMRFVNALVTPALRLSESVFTFRTVYQGWNFVLLGFGILGFVARQLVLLPVEKLEHWAKTQVVRAKVAAPAAITVARTETRSGDRLSMLREYAEAKKMLFQEKRRLAFASIGLVGASQLKAGEDKLVVEHAFSEYRKFLERALNENKVWKFSWSAETVTAVFESPDQAMDAAKYILANMAWFNDGIHQLRTPFRVRCGINCGEVIFPDSKRVEEINDETLDLANALQEAASENVVWLTRDTLSLLRDQNGFRAMTMQQVSGHPVLEWQQTRAAGAAD